MNIVLKIIQFFILLGMIVDRTETDPEYVDCSYNCFNSEIVKSLNY